MESEKKLNTQFKRHQLLSAMGFLKNLHKEIQLAKKLEDIQDQAILEKFQEYIMVLEVELNLKIIREN